VSESCEHKIQITNIARDNVSAESSEYSIKIGYPTVKTTFHFQLDLLGTSLYSSNDVCTYVNCSFYRFPIQAIIICQYIAKIPAMQLILR